MSTSTTIQPCLFDVEEVDGKIIVTQEMPWGMQSCTFYTTPQQEKMEVFKFIEPLLDKYQQLYYSYSTMAEKQLKEGTLSCLLFA